MLILTGIVSIVYLFILQKIQIHNGFSIKLTIEY